MSSRRRSWRQTLTVACGAVALGCLINAGEAAAAGGRQAIPDTHPAWAAANPSGAVTPVTGGNVSLRVYLASPNSSGLAAYAQAVSDPRNPMYGSYLSAAQTQAQFGPTTSEAQAVESWLSGAGLTVTGSTSGFGAYVSVTGTLAQASKAFGVGFATYEDPGQGTERAPEAPATAPVAIAADVAAVSGLSTAPNYMRPQDVLPGPPQNYFIPGPSSSYYGQNLATTEPSVNGASQPWNVAGYTPQQLRGAYGVTQSGMTGKGVTVAVVDAYASPTMQQDADQFSTATGNQPFAPGQYEQILPSYFDLTGPYECGAQGWYGEETLDVESIHDLAPDAKVRYIGAQDCTDPELLAADAFLVTHPIASIVTDSWGEPDDDESIAPAYNMVFEAGAVEGVGFMFSSGDSGYEDPSYEDPYSDQIQVDFPDSSPWVTSVGGTSLAVGVDDTYEWELPWGTADDPLDGGHWLYAPPETSAQIEANYYGSGGGGVSTTYAQPWYQDGVVPNTLATDVPEGSATAPMRVTPDVSALADPSTGMLVGETTENPSEHGYGFYLSRIGGTSVSSPTFAGIEADAQQAAGHDLGFANPVIYARYGTDAFHDITEQTPIGPNTTVFEVRNDYSDAATERGPLLTSLREMGVNGSGTSALVATTGYDDATGVGSPANYIESFPGH